MPLVVFQSNHISDSGASDFGCQLRQQGAWDPAVVQWPWVTHHGVSHPNPTQHSALIGLVGPNFGLEEGGKVLESRGGGQQFHGAGGLHGLVGLVFRKGGTFRIEDAPSHVVEGNRGALHDASQTLVKFRAGFHT